MRPLSVHLVPHARHQLAAVEPPMEVVAVAAAAAAQRRGRSPADCRWVAPTQLTSQPQHGQSATFHSHILAHTSRARCAASPQVVVQGIPWAYTWRELKDLFAEIGGIDRADVAVGYDGRSRVSHPSFVPGACACKYPHAGAAFEGCQDASDKRRCTGGHAHRCHVGLLALPPYVQGYGTVRFTSKEAAEAAVSRFHQSELEGRTLAVFVDRYA